MKLLLIGMGPGIGLAVARRFGREGFQVLMIARDGEKLRAFEQDLQAAGIRAAGYAADIADETSYGQLLEQVAREHPDLDIVHYNASAFHPAVPSEIDLRVFKSDLQINLTGALMAAQAFLPQFKVRGAGALFLTGGGSAFKAPASLTALSIGKAGMRNLALGLAQECAPLGIKVATVTVCGMVQPGTKYDPDLIADAFWRLYALPKGQWETEVTI